VDFARFWQENAICRARPFSTDKPRAALALALDEHWLFGEMAPVSTLRYYQDHEYRVELNKRCNDRLERGIGYRAFAEEVRPRGPERIETLFGCREECTEGSTPWLVPSADSVEELAGILDKVEQSDLAGFFLPDGFRQEWEQRGGGRLGGDSRGPATIGTSVCGTQNYLTWLIDEPDLMDRFHRLLARGIVERDRLLREFSGNAAAGFGFRDDNSCLLSPHLYERFCLPVLATVFDAFSPAPADWRYQHSDSAMGHIMPLLRRVRLNGANFGPEVAIEDIRRELPDAMIHGHVPPFVLMRGTRAEIEQRVMRDFQVDGLAGQLVVTTAGSISCGTSIERMRWLMEIVDDHTCYE
jgi:uroporphyrinogen decarboxylase